MEENDHIPIRQRSRVRASLRSLIIKLSLKTIAVFLCFCYCSKKVAHAMEVLRTLDLPPGFGFHPTDVELISHYLKRKVLGLKIDREVIPEIDIYKHEPWDLPVRCPVPSAHCKWHFFAARDRKYPTGYRLNRTTKAGYWKSTGKDRDIRYQNRVIGNKKTLVFHAGRPPCGKRMDWIMHEFCIKEKECKSAPDMKDSYVLCRVTKRDGENIVPNVPWLSGNIDDYCNQTEDVASLVTAEKSLTPPESVEDIEAWFSELYDPNFSADAILTQVESEPTEAISSVAINQGPLDSNFLAEIPDDLDLLFPVDEFYSILQSDNQTFGDQQRNFLEDQALNGYIIKSNDEFVTSTPTPVDDSANDAGIQIRNREIKPSSSSVQTHKIRLRTSKMEARNGGEPLCGVIKVERVFQLESRSVSGDALLVNKMSVSNDLNERTAKTRFSCFSVSACIVGAVALVCYFAALVL